MEGYILNLDEKGSTMKKEMNGDQALAFGALFSGVKLVSSYPGSPSSGTVEALIRRAKMHDIYLEWSSNEKVAMEMGIGASIAGRRALVCTKSVGLNLMVDPLMALNLTPVHGGLVILLGDDPGGYGSQNDQDSRSLAPFLEMPMMEPASPSEGFGMMQEAFRISEKYHTAMIIRETRSFSQQIESVQVPDKPHREADLGLTREPWRFVPVPLNVVEKHRELHRRIEEMDDWANNCPFNKLMGSGSKGIVAAGFAYRKLLDVLGDEIPGDFRLLKLGLLYPLPRKIIVKLLRSCQEVLIIEEKEPYLETLIKAISCEAGCGTRIHGKQNSRMSREGELFRWQIQGTLNEFMPAFVFPRKYLKEQEAEERPRKENYCGDCQYDRIFDMLDEAAANLGQRPVLVGDPGCLVTVADRLDAKYALGSAVGVADGLSKAGIEQRAVAIFGDSSFFHTALPAICNAVHNRSNILIVVLDNKATASTGFQPNPGVGKDAMGRERPALDIGRIARACGVDAIYEAGPVDLDSVLKDTFQKALGRPGLAVMIVRII
jgi:indolepyruvate ferredoxin oxidoreductase alpha subunit